MYMELMCSHNSKGTQLKAQHKPFLLNNIATGTGNRIKKKTRPSALLSYITTRGFLRTRKMCIEKHKTQPSASLCTSQVFLKISAC